ncbi:MAG TPA: phospholipase D-like domain-containing protein [Chloroflexia bacterium]|nr:phospholipase D-like domain-containing protein [Chloroflexia bacterium]
MIARVVKLLQRGPVAQLAKIVIYSTLLFTATVYLMTYAGLAVAALIRRKRDYRFPHCPLDPVEVDGNQLKIFNYGHETFRDMLEAIDSAEHSIYLETYILKGDIIGQRFKRHLVKKAQEGVKVYIAFDGYGSLLMPFGFRRWPKPVQVTVYGPLHSYLSFLWLGTYTRYHRKILVVDDKIAYLGGMNLGREYATTWRDTHCRIEGPKAQEVSLAFAELWNKRHWLRKSLHINLPYHASSDENQKLFVRESRPSGIFGQTTIRDTYIQAFKQARKHIRLTTPYFLPDEEMEADLLAALERGVRLDMIVPDSSNHAIVDLLARPFYDRLAKAGGRIWLYQRTMIHSKTATIDGFWSTIGSANLDGRSLINYEINLFVRNEQFAARMEEMFRDDLANCRRARPDEFTRPGRFRLMLEILARPLRSFI